MSCPTNVEDDVDALDELYTRAETKGTTVSQADGCGVSPHEAVEHGVWIATRSICPCSERCRGARVSGGC